MGIGRKILAFAVKNDSMKKDPPEIYGWRVFALAFSACFGGMLFGMDIGIIGGVLGLSSFQKAYHVTTMAKSSDPKLKLQWANLQSNIVSTMQGGCFFGCLIAIWVSDKWGRRIALIVSGLVTCIGCLFQAAASGNFSVLYLGRFIAGLGVGAASMLTPLYVAENAPRAIRGGLTGLYQLFIATGVMLAFWVNYGSNLHLKGPAIYITPLALQALPAVMLVICMALNKESPRFLAKVDRWDEAAKVLCNIRQLDSSHPYIQSELGEMSEQLRHERELIGGASPKDLMREMWTIPGNRKRFLISVFLMICQQMTGTNAVNYYAPQIFKALGVPSTNTGLFATGIYGVVKMVSCACFLLFAADSLGRRRSLLWTSIAQGCAMYYIGLYVRIDPPLPGKSIPPAGMFALVCIFLFAGFFQFGWGPVPWIYVSEIPTARLRSYNVAFAAATQWLFNFVVARGTLPMIATMGKGGYGCFLLYGSFCFSFFIFVWFFIPETKGISLERMDDIFGVTELALKVEAEHEAASIHDHNGASTKDVGGAKHIEDTNISEIKAHEDRSPHATV